MEKHHVAFHAWKEAEGNRLGSVGYCFMVYLSYMAVLL